MKLKIFITLILFSSSVFSTQVPEEWLGKSENKSLEGERAVDGAIDEILTLQKESLEEVTAQKSQKGKYFLGALVTSFGVSTSGSIGVLGLSGNATAQMIWAKDILPERPDPTAGLLSPFKPDIFINPGTPKEILIQKIDAISEVLVKSRKVQNEKAVKKNLLEAALNFQKTMDQMNINLAPRFRASGFAVVFGISATGRVSFGVVGGGVSVTMQWNFPKNQIKRRTTTHHDFLNKLENLANLVAEDISVSAQNLEKLANYKIQDIWVGLLFNVSGEVGVASISGQVGGYLIFTPDQEAKSIQKFSDKGEIPLAADSKFIKVARKKIRKGLDLAFRIGGHFAKRAQKHQDAKWKILLINANFSLGLSGNLGVATVGASPSIKVHFLNTNFAKDLL